MARRLRPPDIWLSIDESMLPEAAPWDWDLRPLAQGRVHHVKAGRLILLGGGLTLGALHSIEGQAIQVETGAALALLDAVAAETAAP
jgi:hypothetical protein